MKERRHKREIKKPKQVNTKAELREVEKYDSGLSNHAQLAAAILRNADSHADRFIRRWIAFNAFYNASITRSERERLMAAITDGVTEAQAESILHRAKLEIAYLANLPPGNMRLSPAASHFRSRATIDMNAATDDTLDVRTRLAHLMSAVYQVRCNLFHGAKNPTLPRSQKLIEVSGFILQLVLDVLFENSKEVDLPSAT